MADRPQAPRSPEVEHELGTGGDHDIVKGPRASDDATFVRVGTAEDPFDADLIASALDEANIPVVARAQKDHLLDPLVNPNAPFWAIMVPAEHEPIAREIVERRHAELRASAGDLERAATEEERSTEAPGEMPFPPLGS